MPSRPAVPSARTQKPFTIVIPPPNVTGVLHMGHALNNTLQDILCRFERMRGRDVLWQPGTDHAGIATQMVVERQLAERQEPGRRAMGAREIPRKGVGSGRQESGGAIVNQLRRLGASCDWSRERFTMDEGLLACRAQGVRRAAPRGLIYRDKRLVNWDPKLLTAVSDIEVVQTETKGHLWHFRYPDRRCGGAQRRRRRVDRRRHDAAGDHARRFRRRRASRGRALRISSASTCGCRCVGRLIPIVADDLRPTRRRAPARSRSPRRTTSTTSRSAAATHLAPDQHPRRRGAA